MKDSDFQNIPGWELVSEGLKDISQGNCNTLPALLVLMAAPRLRFLGIHVPDLPGDRDTQPINQQLYHLLEKATPDPYSQYNDLQRRLVSFCHAVEMV